MTYTMILTVENATGTIGYPAIKGVSADMIPTEKAAAEREFVKVGDSRNWEITADI
jgi:hypothetical protein